MDQSTVKKIVEVPNPVASELLSLGWVLLGTMAKKNDDGTEYFSYSLGWVKDENPSMP